MATWVLVASLVSEDGQTRMDSPALPVDFANSVHFAWTGSALAPILCMDGFAATAEQLTLAFRLKTTSTVIERLALGKVVIESSALVYGTKGSPRKNKPVAEDRRRHSVYGYESNGIEPEQRPETLECQQDGLALSMQYVAASYHDGTELGRLMITSLSLSWAGTDIKTLVTRQGHKVCCLLRFNSDYSPRNVETYLGRSQEIVTTPTGERTHRWLSKEVDLTNNTYRGQHTPRLSLSLPPAGQALADEQDLAIIHKVGVKLVNGNTPRALQRTRTICNPSYVEDNDAYANQYKRLPITMQQKETLTIFFYNFKLGPPFGPLQWSLAVKWIDFVAVIPLEEAPPVGQRKRLSKMLKPAAAVVPKLHVLKRPLGAHMTVRIGFLINVVEKTLFIQDVGLRVENFENTLITNK